jgi:signal transduction histidine kinase
VPTRRRKWLKDGLPLLPVTPLLIVVVGLTVAIAVALVGVGELRRASDQASSLRAMAIATTLAARLRVTGSEDRKEVVEGAGRGTYADILLINHQGQIVEDASVDRPTGAELVRCLLAGTGTMETPLLGRTRFAVEPLGPPLEQLSVIAMVPAPSTPTEARGLLRAVAMLTVLLVGAAGFVGYVFAKDVRDDVKFVRYRIAAMAAPDAGPAGAAIPVRALDQVGILTSAFNLLVDRFTAAERSYHQDLTFASALDGERSAFLAALSHELRTPLNGILGFADVLLSEVDGPLDAATREDVGVIRTSASHLRSLIDDILELSALESGGLRLTREAVDVYAIAEEVVREQGPIAASKHLQLELEGLRGAIADADPRRLRQVLGNIVGNAVKFTTHGGVRVIVEDHGGGEVVVHTIDTGPGIAPAARAAIFEEYGQTGDAATRRKGTGLGLAIARRLVTMHGGQIELRSAVGQGSRFTFKLPAFTREIA